jgi:hypothetical protein
MLAGVSNFAFQKAAPHFPNEKLPLDKVLSGYTRILFYFLPVILS